MTRTRQDRNRVARESVGTDTTDLLDVVKGLPKWEDRESSGDCAVIAHALLSNRDGYQAARDHVARYGWKPGKGMDPWLFFASVRDRFPGSGNTTRQHVGTTLRSYLANGRRLWTGVAYIRTSPAEGHVVPVVNGIAANMTDDHWDADLIATVAIHH